MKYTTYPNLFTKGDLQGHFYRETLGDGGCGVPPDLTAKFKVMIAA
jgi:hypothetical protein